MTTTLVRGHVRRGRQRVDEPVSLANEGNGVLAGIMEDGDDLDAEDRVRLHEDLRISAAELERGEVFPIEQVLVEL